VYLISKKCICSTYPPRNAKVPMTISTYYIPCKHGQHIMLHDKHIVVLDAQIEILHP
jgi:hypothetical protein